jgi:hypothetical protein
MGVNWRDVLPKAAALAGFWLFWWVRRELGWEVSLSILAGMTTAILGATTLHCYLRLRRRGRNRRAAFRHCLEWIIN